MTVLVITISALIFTQLIRIWNPHLEFGFRMLIQETKIMRMRIPNTSYGDVNMPFIGAYVQFFLVYRGELLINAVHGLLLDGELEVHTIYALDSDFKLTVCHVLFSTKRTNLKSF